jgi:cell wall-associated NlpC family hydrolase
MIAADGHHRHRATGCVTVHHPAPFPCLAAAAAMVIAGCGAVSPRYRTLEPPAGARAPAPAQAHEDDESRFAVTIRDDLAREDDRVVDLAAVRAEAATPTGATDSSRLQPTGIDRDRVLLDVVGYLGTPYRRGGASKDGVDCSGFTSQVYSTSMRLQLPRSTREQYAAGAGVEKEQLRFGDLVFFNTTGHAPSHVGIYIEDSLFAHASVTQGVTISSLESTYYKKRFVGARRVVEEPPGEQR